MKVLVVGKQNSLFWVENTIDAFHISGVTVEGFYLNKLDIVDTINKNVLKLFSKNFVNKKLSQILERKIISFNPDLILVISPFMYKSEVFDCLDRFDNIIKFAWIGDVFGQEQLKLASKFDKLFVTDYAFINKSQVFKFPSSKYLPLAVNQKRFYDMKLYRSRNLLFIASYTKQRETFLNQINSIEVKVVGAKWNKNNLARNIYCFNKNITIDDVALAYNKSKFILNIKHEHNVIDGLNMRTFEAISAGGCLLQDYVKDVELNFEIDKDIVIYKNLEELNELISKLDKDKRFYDTIIKNGQKIVSQKHTYNHRIKTILEIFKG